MSVSGPILECVPNFSEGRDQAKINAIAEAVRSTPAVSLLHVDTSPAANRTVMTFAGEPAAVTEAAYKAIAKAAEILDMRSQEGTHPRIGATDVCPLVPLGTMHMQDAVKHARLLAERVGGELNIPVYLYEHSAEKMHRRALPDIRKGQYEGFAEKMKHPDWQPDFGPQTFTPATGATVLGARDVLVAFNISLCTTDLAKAVYIAERLRERGYFTINDGKRTRMPGLLSQLRAIGWYNADYGCAQVSMNLLDYRITSPLAVWNACALLAAEAGTELLGAELIGLMPESCLLEAGAYTYIKEDEAVPDDKPILLHAGIEYLGFNKVRPFDPQEKILEYSLTNAGLL